MSLQMQLERILASLRGEALNDFGIVLAKAGNTAAAEKAFRSAALDGVAVSHLISARC